MRPMYFLYCFQKYFSENYKVSGNVNTKMPPAEDNFPSLHGVGVRGEAWAKT